MKRSNNTKNTENVRIAVGIASVAMLVSLLLCTVLRNSGIYMFLPVILAVLFTVICVLLNHIPWVYQKTYRKLGIQVICIIITIVVLLNL